MGRLRYLSSKVEDLPSRVTTQRDEQGHSASAEPWRAWYSTERWRALRLRVFKRDHFRCRCGCGVSEGNLRLLVADHVVPHRGDADLFWDEDNIQTLRKSPCHDKHKQAQERAAWGRG